jgi:hypothetical protein
MWSMKHSKKCQVFISKVIIMTAKLGLYIIYINMARFVCSIMIYWTTIQLLLRQTFLESLWFGIDGNLLCFNYSFSKNGFWQIRPVLQIDNAAQVEVKGRKQFSCTSLALCFRQKCQFQCHVSYLHMLESFCFLFTCCLWSAYLQKKLPSIKHLSVKFLMFIKTKML